MLVSCGIIIVINVHGTILSNFAWHIMVPKRLSIYLTIYLYIYKLMKSTKIISYSCVIWFAFGVHHIMSLCHNCTIINIYKACHMQYYWYGAIDSIALWFVRHLKFDAIHSNNDPHYIKSLIERYSKLNLGSYAHTLAPKVTWSCHRS